jgi:hypothetical protein
MTAAKLGFTRQYRFSPVVPAKAGTHFDFASVGMKKQKWIPAFAGMTARPWKSASPG